MTAVCIVHTPTGPVLSCEEHAGKIERLMRHLGAHTYRTPAEEGHQCINCLQGEIIMDPKTENTESKNAEIIEDKALRVYFDAGLQRLKQQTPSRERSLAITKTQEAIMWLGMDLKRLNEQENPYPNSYDPSNTTVDPTADGLKL